MKAAAARVQVDRDSGTAEALWRNSVQRKINPKFLYSESLGTLWTVIPEPFSTTQPSQSAPAETFCQRVEQEMKRLHTDQIVIFVHGFDTSVQGNAETLAAIWHYSGRRFVPIQYEWPSDVRILDYTVDKQNAARSVRSLRLLLDLLSQRTSARRINLLGHSAGTPVVVQALHELRLIGSGLGPEALHSRYHIGSVVLAAPDMDTVEYLNAMMDGLLDLTTRVTIYMSSGDLALRLSRWLFGETRLGFIDTSKIDAGEAQWLASIPNATAVDVEEAMEKYPDFLGHGYFYRNPIVANDIFRVLLDDASPADRGLVHNPKKPSMWEFSHAVGH